MAISYINDGSASVKAAEKIKVVYHEKVQRTNPWINSRVLPIESEALATGGGLYRFQNILGYEAAVRRSGKPTTNTVTYEDGMSVGEVTLTVTQPIVPLNGKVYTFEQGDVVQLDGIDFSARSTMKVMNVLIQGEIDEDSDKVLNTAGTRNISETAGTALEDLTIIKDAVADYFDISATNTNWTTEGYKYFDAQKGAYTKEQIFVHMHPADIAKYSNINTEAGAGSPAQFLQFEQGTLAFVNGAKVISNRFVTKGTIVLLPTDMIGTPDPAVMFTKVWAYQNDNTDTKHINGKHYYDSILVAPELVTKVTFTA